MKPECRVGYALLGVGVTLVVLAAVAVFRETTPAAVVLSGLGLLLVVVGVRLAFDVLLISSVKVGSTGFEAVLPEPVAVPQKTLPDEELRQRVAYANENPPPAHDAPAFNALTDAPDIASIPGSDPLVPMYLLDRNFRILDWNEAFALAFDRSMEGRRGQSAVEWVYLLDNFKEVLDHANRVFSDPGALPRFDKEELAFTSERYGKLTAAKRAYQFTDDDGAYAGWLVVLDVKFKDGQSAEQYRLDLVRHLQRALLWTEYSLSYDKVLVNSPLYRDLLAKICGETPNLPPIKEAARVLDLGAGTGNIASRLVNGKRVIICVENNRTMLGMLRAKCQPFLRQTDDEPGVIALKQDASSLFGLPHGYFDTVIANNVFYTLPRPENCLKQIARRLKPGGEVRISGPSRGFSIDKVFRALRKGLEQAGQYEALQKHLEHAQVINTLLQGDLRTWAERDLSDLLAGAGLEPVPKYDTTFYQGNGLIRVGRKC
jgi:SAM-dependent methyltransferase